ncbi:hypothetical protein F8B43_3894 [Methylorubrum populi]|uniref:Uncharacterized protein n=1 Tax=Methylorubrum populi TaxID=223967 RepID=A0A833MY63_9HYPH|nr:hypothetical protein F8B43_3894 [Methylorubrum populi]
MIGGIRSLGRRGDLFLIRSGDVTVPIRGGCQRVGRVSADASRAAALSV